MSRFDLSNAADFARLTGGTLGQLVSDFAGRDPGEWQLLEGSYNGILFHVFQSKSDYQAALPRITDTGGRRKVKYSFPYKDGQTTDDLGRKPQGFEAEILIHGERYMNGVIRLMAEFNKPTPGEFVHPVMGKMTVAVEDIQISHSSDTRRAALLKVTFTEHNFSVGDLGLVKDPSVKGALAQALDAFQKIESAILQVEGAVSFARTIKNQIKQALDEYKFQFGVTLTAMNGIFNPGSSTDIPSLLPVNEGGTRNSDGTLEDPLFVSARSVSDPFNEVPVADLSPETATAIAVSQITNQVSALRVQLGAVIASIDANGGSLELFDTNLDLKQTAVQMQDVLEKGIASSQAQIIDYTTPQEMSIREVAFANGLSVQRVQDIDLLNPDLLSVNFIAKGTQVKVPVS